MKKRIFAWLLVCCLAFSSCSLENGLGGLGGGDIGGIIGGGSQTENENNGGNGDGTVGDGTHEDDGTVGGGGQEDDGTTGGGGQGGNDDGTTGGGGQGGNDDGTVGGGGQEDGKEDCVDVNDDGICDDCRESVVVTLDLYAVNDLHGKVLDGRTHPGVDELSTYLKNARAKNPNTLFLSSGDMWQGMAVSNLTDGKLVTEWMNEMNFVSMTLGNHEYDWGEEVIQANAELAEFPFLAINIYDKTTNQRVDYCQPSVLVEQGGLKIGIIGAMGDCYNSISQENVAGVTFKTGSALTSLVKAEAQSLRNRGADCIIYSVHDGYQNYDSALSSYVDVVFEGHTHSSYVNQDGYGVYHLQGGGDNKGITYAQLKVNFARNESDTYEAKTVATNIYSGLDGDSVVDLVASRYPAEMKIAYEPLGKNDAIRESSEISSLVAKLYYEAGVKKWGGKYEIALGGGSLNLRSPYKIFAGNVVYGDVYDVLTFDNQLELCKVTGSILKSRFINNSEYYVYTNSALTSNIVDTKEYYIVLDTWSSRYDKNKTTVIDRYDETTFARDLLADYIKGGGWTAPVVYTSIPEILSIGSKLSHNAETTEVYYVKGKIISFNSTTWGNCTIEDENGNQLYVYGMYDESGNRYDAMSNQPQVGDTLILMAKVKKYNATIELVNATIYSRE